MAIPVEDRIGLSAERAEVVRQFVAPQRTLEDILRDLHRLVPRRTVLNVVTQDEFTHDVVVELGPDLFLVYDTT